MLRGAAWLGLLLSLAACGELIGIDDAHYDSSLEPGSEKAADGGQGGDAEAGEGASCERYCDEILSVCEGDEAQYPNRETCLAVCAAFPRGTTGTKENSLACRSRQVELAAIEPLVHCPFAGPGGAGECGSNCEGLCAITMATCSSETSSSYYADIDACLADCAEVPDLGEYGTGESEYTTGDHVQCRLYHATAATQDAEHHCPHALGGDPCVND
jgi:hypothetical protein